MSDHTKLLVWQRAHALAIAIHRFRIPSVAAPGLSNQLKRAAASIPANIAEGAGLSKAEFAQRIEIAIGESREVENHLTLARALGVVRHGNPAMALDEVVQIRKMLHGLLRYLRGQQAQ